jgi:hypothetical protein
MKVTVQKVPAKVWCLNIIGCTLITMVCIKHNVPVLLAFAIQIAACQIVNRAWYKSNA